MYPFSFEWPRFTIGANSRGTFVQFSRPRGNVDEYCRASMLSRALRRPEIDEEEHQ
jgi:hypothetical protein